MEPPVLYIFAGLPGVGKTTLAREIAQRVRASYMRIDTIEQALRDLCSLDVQGEGYALAYRLAADSLCVGTNVVADSCNPVGLTRRSWERVALDAGAHFVNIEVVCSDASEHRRRVESRAAIVPGLTLPTWSEVQDREYDQWAEDRIVIDTFQKPETSCVDELISKLSHRALPVIAADRAKSRSG